VRFSGLGEYLVPLIGRHDLLDERLRGMTRPDLLPRPDHAFIGVHVRRGDYPSAWRLPIEWYRDGVMSLRAELGRPVAVRVFSDGADGELLPLLDLPASGRAAGAAITDLLELSQAACIVPSASTFSTWAGYLRQAPMVWLPGRSMRTHDDANLWRCVDWDGRSPLPERLLAEVDRRSMGEAEGHITAS
jgi:hypothetical protein